jgi:hypothetical protein
MRDFANLQTHYLARLAKLVSDIDDHKQDEGYRITICLHAAQGVIGEMKMELLDIGQLQEIFDRMNWMPTETPNCEQLLAFIKEAHDEIKALLGDEQHLIYCPADEEEPCHV